MFRQHELSWHVQNGDLTLFFISYLESRDWQITWPCLQTQVDFSVSHFVGVFVSHFLRDFPSRLEPIYLAYFGTHTNVVIVVGCWRGQASASILLWCHWMQHHNAHGQRSFGWRCCESLRHQTHNLCKLTFFIFIENIPSNVTYMNSERQKPYDDVRATQCISCQQSKSLEISPSDLASTSLGAQMENGQMTIPSDLTFKIWDTKRALIRSWKYNNSNSAIS